MASVWLKIVRHEWRGLVADRTAWIVAVFFAVTIGYAITNGAISMRREQQAAQKLFQVQEAKNTLLKQRAAEMQAYTAAGNRIEALPRYERYEYDFGPLDSRYAAAHNPFNAVLPPSPLAAITVGQNDLYSAARTVSWWNSETISAGEQTENPLKLLTGNFDLAFVALYLFPLFILALSFNLLASEKENGVLGLLLSQPVSLKIIVTSKIIARASLIFGYAFIFSVIGILLSGINLSEPETLLRLFVWMLAAAAYGTFWFGLAILINALGRSAAANALLLISCWLLFVVLIPTIAALLASLLYPIPSRALLVNAEREIPDRVEKMNQDELREKFHLNHAEFPASGNYSDWGKYAIGNVAQHEETARQLELVKQRFDKQLAGQQTVENVFQFVSPTILLRQILNEISGAGQTRYRDYRAQSDDYNRKWKDYFWQKMFTQAAFTPDQYDSIPRFVYRKESFAEVFKRAFFLLITIIAFAFILGFIGIRVFGNYPVAT